MRAHSSSGLCTHSGKLNIETLINSEIASDREVLCREIHWILKSWMIRSTITVANLKHLAKFYKLQLNEVCRCCLVDVTRQSPAGWGPSYENCLIITCSWIVKFLKLNHT